MKQTSSRHEQFILQAISVAVIGNGLVVLAASLLAQLRLHGLHDVNDVLISLPLISGLTLVYLGALLHRRKRAAWAVIVPVYSFLLTFNFIQFLTYNQPHHPWVFVRNILLPLAVVSALIYFRRVFTVKSAIQNLSVSLRVIVILLAIILAYGTTGYVLLDRHDFHQDITVPDAFHRTVDQFDFTTSQELTAYTRRAAVFIDSLNILSAVAVGYIIISLFGPIRAKFTSQAHNREHAEELLKETSSDSEDFFKIWPADKNYFSEDENPQTLLAYRVQRGVGLVVGDPIGQPEGQQSVIGDYLNLCRVNDWLPAFIHIPEESRAIYESKDFQLQLIGQEAVVDINKFLEETAHDKYFRQITNKFTKQGYTSELLKPPHDKALISRIQEVSEDWLSLPGRQERGFMMGYFSEAYMQLCNLVVARDSAGTIQGFLNQIPTYQPKEANFDLLRHTKRSLGNINDYLLMSFIEKAQEHDFRTVNLGLCPLSGIDKESAEKSVIDSTMRFVYANGNRFYSFNGLRRFKAKYDPVWRDRYIAYKGGVRGFTRVIYALNKAMNRTK